MYPTSLGHDFQLMDYRGLRAVTQLFMRLKICDEILSKQQINQLKAVKVKGVENN